MTKLLITLIVTVALAVSFLSIHAPEEITYDGPDSRRGCVASALQADARGLAGTTLEANLAVCDQLLVAN